LTVLDEGYDNMAPLQRLDWDSRFFGFPIARIINPAASIDELREAVSLMKSWQIPLAYWSADDPSDDVRSEALRLGGRMVDEKLTFSAEISSTANVDPPQADVARSYRDGMSIDDLKQLAVDSGVYSRFVVDPRFPRDKARTLFEEWMLRSLDKAYADDVLVIPQANRIAGMATVVQKDGYVSIGLVAVGEEFRGRGFGETLVRAAITWCRERAIHQIQVTTQSANLPARRLYQKCGFELAKTEFVYHFWSDVPGHSHALPG
jgi:dTDP-4-amino-4,6-dideoxy-D-galactose acyltransferase